MQRHAQAIEHQLQHAAAPLIGRVERAIAHAITPARPTKP